MSYAEKVLQPGEQITYRGRLHWVVYLSGLLVVLLAAAIAVGAVLVLKDPRRGSDSSWPRWCSWRSGSGSCCRPGSGA